MPKVQDPTIETNEVIDKPTGSTASTVPSAAEQHAADAFAEDTENSPVRAEIGKQALALVNGIKAQLKGAEKGAFQLSDHTWIQAFNHEGEYVSFVRYPQNPDSYSDDMAKRDSRIAGMNIHYGGRDAGRMNHIGFDRVADKGKTWVREASINYDPMSRGTYGRRRIDHPDNYRLDFDKQDLNGSEGEKTLLAHLQSFAHLLNE